MAQCIHLKNAERMLLASFVAGVPGVPSHQVLYVNPQSMQEELTIAQLDFTVEHRAETKIAHVDAVMHEENPKPEIILREQTKGEFCQKLTLEPIPVNMSFFLMT